MFKENPTINSTPKSKRRIRIDIDKTKLRPEREQLYRQYILYVLISYRNIRSVLTKRSKAPKGKDYLVHKTILDSRIEMLDEFKVKFRETARAWNILLRKNKVIPITRKNANRLEEQALLMAIWDSAYMRDVLGQLSPYGPTLFQMQFYGGNAPMGIIPALRQQENSSSPYLTDAQYLADSIYHVFLEFVDKEKIHHHLKGDYRYAPLIQNAPEVEHIRVSERKVPTLIVMNQAKTIKFNGYSAVPHEVGHDIMDTFKDSGLIREIQGKVRDCKEVAERKGFWLAWVEECFADAIAVMTSGLVEIVTLADLFSGDYTNRVNFSKDSNDHAYEPDRHPNRHIRVLLTLKVAEKVMRRYEGFLKRSDIKRIRDNWEAFEQKNNTNTQPGFLEHLDIENHHAGANCDEMSHFVKDLDAISEILINDTYRHLNHKSPYMIFENLHKSIDYKNVIEKFDLSRTIWLADWAKCKINLAEEKW